MIPVHQRIHGNGKNGEALGDCLKCCVASILELPYEDVPHFAAGEWKVSESSTWLENLNDWLLEKGWSLRASANFYYKHWPRLDEFALETKPRNWHDGFWIGAVLAARGAGNYHAVVMYGDSVMHEPGLEQPRPVYEYLGEILLLPLDPSQARAW